MCLCVSESTGEEPAGINASEHVLTPGTTHTAVVCWPKCSVLILLLCFKTCNFKILVAKNCFPVLQLLVFYASEIPTDDDDPASTVRGPVSAQGITHTVFLGTIVHTVLLLTILVVAVGRQSGDDKTSSPNTINGKVMTF